MAEDKKAAALFISMLLLVIVIVVIGPFDLFTHGFYCEEIDCGQIAQEDFQGTLPLEEDRDYEMTFSPKKPHFAGFSIYLVNRPEDNSGNMILTVSDKRGKILDTVEVDLSKVKNAAWYKVYTAARLKEGEKYTLRFSAGSSKAAPHLQKVDEDYLPAETETGNILLSYAYAESTFTFQNKIIIALFMLAFWLFLCAVLMDIKAAGYLRVSACAVFMTAVLAWNYMYNSMDNQNSGFGGFQSDSETLVTGMLYAGQDREGFREDHERGFGMGRYFDLKGALNSYGMSYLTDDNWLNGYSRSEGAIIVNSNIYSKEVAVAGNSVLFGNGERYSITNINDDGTNILIYLDSGKVLTSAKNGSLDDAAFYNPDDRQLPVSRITAYKSQYGLQGKIFTYMAGHMEEDQGVLNLNLLCAVMTALVFSVIVLLVSAKYNKVLAGCFFVTFWLSPWIVNFARNLYWVEFTWFVPMAIGLFCAWKIDCRECRVLSYILTFVAIMVKCLCGYEYISAIMLGLVSFLAVDFVLAFLEGDEEQAGRIFRTTAVLGAAALLGFMTAVCIHAPLKGDGSIIEGIKNIFEYDILRRTSGADLNNFDPGYWPAINTSVWETYCKYFHFSTEVITGITGNLFPLLCIIPLCIFGYDFKKEKLDVELPAMYVVFFLTPVSWFCLAKGHSYVHTHMNYVLWYFGFVQICFYVIVNKAIAAAGKEKSGEGRI